MKKLLAAVAVIGLGTVSAFGADLPARGMYTKAPAVMAVENWTGFYVGVNAGALWTNHDFSTVENTGTHSSIPANLALISAAGTGSSNKTGFIGGGQIGYNWQAPASAWVFGLEADISGVASDSTRTGAGTLSPLNIPFSISNSGKYDWMATIRGRIGYAADKSLLYVTGGLAVADLKLTSTYVDSGVPVIAPPGAGSGTTSSTKTGWTLGGGWEYAFAPAWSAKLEYLYVHFDGTNLNYAITDSIGGTNAVHVNGSFDQNHIVRVGVNYRFGGPMAVRY